MMPTYSELVRDADYERGVADERARIVAWLHGLGYASQSSIIAELESQNATSEARARSEAVS